MTSAEWDIYVVSEVLEWIDELDGPSCATAIPLAEKRYEAYLTERGDQEGGA